VLAALRRKINLMLADTVLWRTGAWKAQQIIHDSAFNLERLCKDRTFESIIFSPPYANRFDYFEAFKVELWFGSFVETYPDLGKLRKASMRSHLNADFKRPTFGFEPLEELINLMDRNASSWRMGVPNLLRGYFSDLRNILSACRAKLNGGKCYVVVGNSAFAGVVFPTDLLTALLSKTVGFRRSRIIEVRHLTVAPQQRNRLRGYEDFMRESIVVLE
jgi:site-specific DNA-methyltransferase (adenine-specific)